MKIPEGRQASLLGFCTLHHHPQKRKYTGEPYHFHLRSVANMADRQCRFGYEIGLCHDLLEDTECTEGELFNALVRFGYTENEAKFITERVVDLTDVYTHDNYPHLNRYIRKSLEAKRLHKIHPDSQTVKYCDLIDNTSSIVEHDKGFAVKYLEEKKTILNGMKQGNPQMLRKCRTVLKKALKTLNKIGTIATR